MTIRLRLDLAYDGAPFAGFARQPDQTTVQGVLEDALERVLGQAVDTICAGRTDRGVHALAQVVHVEVDQTVERAAEALRDPDALEQRLDHMFGEAVTLWRLRWVGEDFDARFGAVERRYRYEVVDAPRVEPRRRCHAWVVGEPLETAAMRAGAARLVGEHDFASFCRQAGQSTTTRTLSLATVAREPAGGVCLRFAGPAFCHQQVRSMVGCLVEVGRGRRPPAWIADVLEGRDRAAAAAVAPPHGLVLEGVGYGSAFEPSPPARWLTPG